MSAPPAPRLAAPRPLRGLLFLLVAYAAMAAVGLLYLPAILLGRDGAHAAARAWCRFARGAARVLVGLRTEVRGEPPAGEVLVCAKHQSFLDIILIYGALPRGRFVMKRELAWTPVLGQVALRMGCIPVDRGRGGQALRQMLLDAAAGRDPGGQVVIYPQGTRVLPGAVLPYRPGAAALYAEFGVPCVPVACNVGLFWPRSGVRFRPGLATVEFLPPFPPGLPPAEFLRRLEAAVEPASGRLMAEAGFGAPGAP